MQLPRKNWISIQGVLINLDHTTKILVQPSGLKLIFYHPIPTGTGTGATQAFTYVDNAAALAALDQITSIMTDQLNIVTTIT